MGYQHNRDLHLTYDDNRGYWHFVLYIEPPVAAGAEINAGCRFDASSSRYATTWLQRLTDCEPDALHVALIGGREARALWDPCVYDDPESPSAVAGDGCVCWKSSRDPITWLPVVAHHHRTVSGNIETWTHHTFAPLELPETLQISSLIIDHEADTQWVRLEDGTLQLLPEVGGRGYSAGYSGSGPSDLGAMIEQIVERDGYGITASGLKDLPDEKVFNWVSSSAAAHTQELSLEQLKTLC
jgi:hypothetical protein